MNNDSQLNFNSVETSMSSPFNMFSSTIDKPSIKSLSKSLEFHDKMNLDNYNKQDNS